jgi:hypothetical protein
MSATELTRTRRWTATYRRGGTMVGDYGPEIEASLSGPDLLAEQTVVAAREVGWTLRENEYAIVTLYKTTKAHGRKRDRDVTVERDERGIVRWRR